MYDAREVANFLLDHSQSQNQSLTNMALNKIIYFAHGWYLASKGSPLIRNRFEAWQHGPVIRVIYEQFSKFGSKPIQDRAMSLDLETESYQITSYDISEGDKSFIINVFQAYSTLHAFELSNITHEKNSPWDKIWNNKDGSVRFGMTISNDEIREYFLTVTDKRLKN
ncbi:Panacea domain-containing protein [Azospirillum rugosum]|uniref:Phage-associated protein n=1 Tax=Azospirillum rugosum TaxID=416170 RepID=A0ABS4SRJ6_9PROT|nr:type II toxin-antitoxin system antitoxin SocA domain-containing protein [Azospirillum rugosum]MBP2295175.1 putative phage-associated protein [Azospirillum rugosum]MDQ0528549.1 putative phage-associated protein [Azospirillum rugosum]